MNQEQGRPQKAQVRRYRRTRRRREWPCDETLPSNFSERAQKPLLKSFGGFDEREQVPETIKQAPECRSDLLIQDEQVSRSIVFRPIFDEKSGVYLFDGVEKRREDQWNSYPAGSSSRPLENLVRHLKHSLSTYINPF